MKRLLVLALGASLLPVPGLAHDFWLQPQRFDPAAGEHVAVGVLIGHAGEREPYARNPRHILEFACVAGDRRVPIVGRPGGVPAGSFEVPAEGPFTLLYRSRATRLEMQAEKFESYLREAGLEHAIETRERLGESDRPGVESYSRAAKVLGRTRGRTEGPWLDTPVGLDLELHVEGDLGSALRLESGSGPLRLRATWLGEAAAGLRIELEPLEGRATDLEPRALDELRGTTDETGRIRFELPAEGTWKATTVRMERAPKDADHHWRSVFGSLVFQVRAANETDSSGPSRSGPAPR